MLIQKIKKLVKKILGIKSPLDIYSYSIDIVDEVNIVGWALKKDALDDSVLVEIRSNDLLLWTTSANIYRQDLRDKDIGNGIHGFLINPLISTVESNDVKEITEIDIFLDGLKANVKPLPLNLMTSSSSQNHRVSSDNKTKPSKDEKEQAKFKKKFSNEITAFKNDFATELKRLETEVEQQSQEAGGAMNVAMENIAALSIRVGIIEQVLIKYFSSK